MKLLKIAMTCMVDNLKGLLSKTSSSKLIIRAYETMGTRTPNNKPKKKLSFNLSIAPCF